MTDTTPVAVFIHPDTGTPMAVSSSSAVTPATPSEIGAFVNAGGTISTPPDVSTAASIANSATPPSAPKAVVPPTPPAPTPQAVAALPPTVAATVSSISGVQAPPSPETKTDPMAKGTDPVTGKTTGGNTDIVAMLKDHDARLSKLESMGGAASDGSSPAKGSIGSRLEKIEASCDAIFSKYFANELPPTT